MENISVVNLDGTAKMELPSGHGLSDAQKFISLGSERVQRLRLALKEAPNISGSDPTGSSMMEDLWANSSSSSSSHLYNAFWDKGIDAFVHDGVEMGEEIPQAQVIASEQSRTSIIDEIVDDRENMRTEDGRFFQFHTTGIPQRQGPQGWPQRKVMQRGCLD